MLFDYETMKPIKNPNKKYGGENKTERDEWNEKKRKKKKDERNQKSGINREKRE